MTINLSWQNNDPNTASFRIEIALGAAAPFEFLAETQNLSYTDARDAGVYRYRVFGLAGGYASQPSNEVVVTVLGAPGPLTVVLSA